MSNPNNEWNDPPGVDLDSSVESASANEDTSDETSKTDAASARPRGPFSTLRTVLNVVFWGGLLLAAAVGGLTPAAGPTLSPMAGAVKLALAFFITIGWWVAVAWWAAWIIDKILVYLKHG